MRFAIMPISSPAARCARGAGLALLLAAGLLALGRAQASAVILPATTIDGPSQDIVGFGGVAMAEDGTGGLVYLKQVGGVAHVFVARYIGGHWQAPIEVDGEQPYGATSPRIGAADGGELVVVWATPFASEDEKPVYELLSATLGPGSSSFGPALIVDRDIRRATDVSPDLAMSSTGQADVVYRVVQEAEGNSSIPLLEPNDVIEQVRVAHFNGERWSALGAINRDSGVSMRPPTQANAPQIAIGPTGSAVVVWQEPEIDGVARIWARRIFGSNVNYVMPVTATTYNGQPIDEDADAPSVAISRLGQAVVAYRQVAGPGSPLPGPRIFLNTLPDGEAEGGGEFVGASIADTAVPGGKAASVGRPSVDIDEKRETRLLYDANGTPRVRTSTDLGVAQTLSLGPSFAGSALAAANELPTASVMNPEGGGVSAWPSADSHGRPAVAVQEAFPGGAAQTALVSGGAGGPIGELGVGRSGLGDGLIAFQQGAPGDAAIVAAQATAPPTQFVLTVPHGWIKPSQASISWLPATSAVGSVSYTVVLNGHRVATPAGALSLRLSPSQLASGKLRLQVLATDGDGAATLTPASTIEVDGTPPTVKVTRTQGEHAVTVHVIDPDSGVETRLVSVNFGDGHSAGGRATLSHRYTRAGIYTVVIHVRDKLGNAGLVRRLVQVR